MYPDRTVLSVSADMRNHGTPMMNQVITNTISTAGRPSSAPEGNISSYSTINRNTGRSNETSNVGITTIHVATSNAPQVISSQPTSATPKLSGNAQHNTVLRIHQTAQPSAGMIRPQASPGGSVRSGTSFTVNAKTLSRPK
jgi:hypothetical protein